MRAISGYSYCCYYLTVILVTFSGVRCASISLYSNDYYAESNGCDWEGSGSVYTDSNRLVVPVYLRCSRGTIKWFYPKGGLRVVLRHGTGNKDFRGCIRVEQNVSAVRMYIEGNQQLHKLYANDDGKHIDLLRCFVSVNGKLTIFVETEPAISADLKQQIVKFSYDLQSVSTMNELLHDYEECRPCSDEQLVSTFCRSDFIIEGTISALFHNKHLERSELTIRAHNVIKDPFDYTFTNADYNSYNYNDSNSNASIDSIVSHYGIKHYTLYRPLKCGTKAGSGTQFLFFGRWILGNPVITCAPKLSHWKHVKSKALENGSNECQLV